MSKPRLRKAKVSVQDTILDLCESKTWALSTIGVVPAVWASQVVLVVKKRPANAGDIRDLSLISESGRSPGGGNGNPLQYSYLETLMDRWACWATTHSVAELDMTEVTYYACTCCLQANHASGGGFDEMGTSLLRVQVKKRACICSVLGIMTGEGDGTPLQYSCLENPMDGGAW